MFPNCHTFLKFFLSVTIWGHGVYHKYEKLVFRRQFPIFGYTLFIVIGPVTNCKLSWFLQFISLIYFIFSNVLLQLIIGLSRLSIYGYIGQRYNVYGICWVQLGFIVAPILFNLVFNLIFLHIKSEWKTILNIF